MDLTRLNILLVDDNVHMRNLAKTILRALGVGEIRECIDGESGLEEMKIFNPRLIIADWIMAPMNGIDFVRQVRLANDSANPYVPILMMTSEAFPENVKEARDAGVNGFLVKPISARVIYQRFEDVLDRPMPFVRTDDYFGPDRRRRNRDVVDENRIRNVLDPIKA